MNAWAWTRTSSFGTTNWSSTLVEELLLAACTAAYTPVVTPDEDELDDPDDLLVDLDDPDDLLFFLEDCPQELNPEEDDPDENPNPFAMALAGNTSVMVSTAINIVPNQFPAIVFDFIPASLSCSL